MRSHPVSRSWSRRRLLVGATSVVMFVGGLGWPSLASAADGVPVTYPGHAYATSVTTPSEDKPQSKLWFTDGAWWALMVEAGGTAVTIHRLLPDHTWTNTRTLVDNRVGSTGDALWSSRDGKLYVASRVNGTGDGARLQIRRFSYDATRDTWAVDTGFPAVVATGGGSESATIDQDSTGRLWVTYTRGSRVWVSFSTDQGATWALPFNPSVPDTTITADDISAVIAFGSSIGILWSDQGSATQVPAVRFAIHDNADPVGVWRVEDALSGSGLADDHINLKQLVGDTQGRIFAAVKTSADEVGGASPSDTLVGVLVRTSGGAGAPGTWSLAPAGTLAQGWTRPMIMIDETNAELYFFATTGVGGPDIVYKKSPLSAISFPAGNGQLFVNPTFSVNHASGAKDPVTAATGLVVLASSASARRYAHAEMDLTGGGAGGSDTTAPTVTGRAPGANATAVAVGSRVTATFSEDVLGVDGASFRLAKQGDTATVAAVVSRNGTTNQWILDPNANLAPDTRYVATLIGGTSAIRDSSGTPLATDSWEFLTGPAPTVSGRSPAVGAVGVSRTGNVTVTFKEAVQNVTAATFYLTPAGSTAVVAAGVTRDGTTNRWILDPGGTLDPRRKYTVTVAGGADGITDLAGNRLAGNVTWSFTTGA